MRCLSLLLLRSLTKPALCIPLESLWQTGCEIFFGFVFLRRRSSAMGSTEFSWKLADHPKLPKGKTIALVVLDGWGEAAADQYNCVHVAETPTMDALKNVTAS